MLSPKERAVLSIPSRSDFAGKSAAIRAYPGRKSTSGSPSMFRIEVSLNPGVSTKMFVRSTSPITIRRSDGIFFPVMQVTQLVIKNYYSSRYISSAFSGE